MSNSPHPINTTNDNPIVDVVFCREIIQNGKPILTIDELKLLDFLQLNGFGRHVGSNGKTVIARQSQGNDRISRVSSEQVRDFVWDYVRNLEEKITFSFNKKDLQLLLIKKPSLFSRSRLNWLKPLQNGGAS